MREVLSLLILCLPLSAFISMLAAAAIAEDESVAGVQLKKLPQEKLDLIPVNGTRVAEMADFDNELLQFMEKWKLPGAQAAIVYKGRLVFSRAYGYASKEKKEPVTTESLFRMGSISKLFTAVAVLKLIEEKKLSFESRAFPLLELPPEKDPSRQPEARVNEITVRNLLEGSGGWDRNAAGDPMFMPICQHAALEYSNSLRPTARAIIRYEYTRRLDFNPGSKFCYSNLGYAVLGELVSKLSGMKYDQYVRTQIFEPMGIVNVFPGKTRKARAGEVHYYAFPGEAEGYCVCPNVKGYVPLEYGGDFYLEAMTADCGWIASSYEVANFTSCLFGEKGQNKALLSKAMLETMIAKPKLDDWNGTDHYFAMGWEVELARKKGPAVKERSFTIKKEGCLPGSTALVVHKLDGRTMVLVFNTRPQMATFFQEEMRELVDRALDSSSHRSWFQKVES